MWPRQRLDPCKQFKLMIRLENVLKKSLQDVLMLSWRRLQNAFKTSLRCTEYVFARVFEDVLKTSRTNIQVLIKTFRRRMSKVNIFVLVKTSWRHLEDVSWRRRRKTSWRCLQDVFIKKNVNLVNWSSKEKRRHFLYHLFCPKGIFSHLCLPQCIVCWVHFQNINFYSNILKNITWYTFLLVSKIVESLQCILNHTFLKHCLLNMEDKMQIILQIAWWS